MKKLKYEILFTILFMTVGIAAVSSNILINGSTPIASNPDDFNVYFSNVLVDGEQDLSLIRNGTALYFDFEFDELGETKVITYDITNASKNYDADIDITCTQSTAYLTITNSFDTNSYLSARSTRSGQVTLTLYRSFIQNYRDVSVRCSINAFAAERNSHKSDSVPDIPVRKFNVGEEIIIGSEKFNVISDNGNTVSMLAQKNIRDTSPYKQTSTNVWSIFSDDDGWEYTPGPKEIDVQRWGGDAKDLLNKYVSFLKSEYDADVTADMVTLGELSDLGCLISADYSSNGSGWNCNDSKYIDWIDNDQTWWTRSASSSNSFYLWLVNNDGTLKTASSIFNSGGVRPLITISKEYFDSKIIEFTIDGTTYYAEEGMYWSEWVASKYNTGGYVIYQDEKNFHVTLHSYDCSVNDGLIIDTIIQSNVDYTEKCYGWLN